MRWKPASQAGTGPTAGQLESAVGNERLVQFHHAKRKEVALSWIAVTLLDLVAFGVVLISLCTLLVHRLTSLVKAIVKFQKTWREFKHPDK